MGIFNWFKKTFSTSCPKVKTVDELIEEVRLEKKERGIIMPGHLDVVPFGEEAKEKFASLLRPIVKSYNKEKKEEYAEVNYNIDYADLKTLKVYGSFVDDNHYILKFQFTQSDKYNSSIAHFVQYNIYKEFLEAMKSCEDLDKFVDVNAIQSSSEDGKILISIRLE